MTALVFIMPGVDTVPCVMKKSRGAASLCFKHQDVGQWRQEMSDGQGRNVVIHATETSWQST